MKIDAMGARCKKYEALEAERILMPGLPLLVRLDGRAFHTYTRGLKRPFDERVISCMDATTKQLVAHFHADVGYTQSDEITLLFAPKMMEEAGVEAEAAAIFGGRVSKLTSVLAGFASVAFYKASLVHLPEKAELTPHFDARVWCVPNRVEAVEVFVWREADAVRCSLNTLAQAHFNHKALHGKKSAEVHEMLHGVGVNWSDLPARQKRGGYFQRKLVVRAPTEEEMARVPARYLPGTVTRSSVEMLELPPLRSFTVEQAWGKLVGEEA